MLLFDEKALPCALLEWPEHLWETRCTSCLDLQRCANDCSCTCIDWRLTDLNSAWTALGASIQCSLYPGLKIDVRQGLYPHPTLALAASCGPYFYDSFLGGALKATVCDGPDVCGASTVLKDDGRVGRGDTSMANISMASEVVLVRLEVIVQQLNPRP